MDINRRRLLAGSAAAGTVSAAAITPAAASTQSFAVGIDATQLGVRPGSPDDQSRAFQRAIERAANIRTPLLLPPGTYRACDLVLPPHAQIIGVRGGTRIELSDDVPLLRSSGADNIGLFGLVLDGGGKPLRKGRGLVQFSQGLGLHIAECEFINSGGDGIVLEKIAGQVRASHVANVAGSAIFSRDARGLVISTNNVRDAGNNGILVWRSVAGEDKTLVIDNHIENIAARAGGNGQNGNAINVFRAGNVIVRGNSIRGAAFSAIRGNAASNLQILGNNCTDLGEVALYAEFGFEGAVIANNIVDGAAIGVAVTNFNEGGRLGVVQGNLLRNLDRNRIDDGHGIGIGVEADTAVTGNVIENAPSVGIAVGYGKYLRDVAVTGNIVRSAGIGIGVSVAPGAGSALIANNLIAGAKEGAIVGSDGGKRVTGDLTKVGADRYAHLSIGPNSVN
ncbi:MAG: TIGR03808 family TAT-translocated repetitive protein [Pseudomonadota bacterium]|nr:TIGR03808 family TAT-translocated repetitive protein [Pseudomonadota bacterium]